jgi:hypothetical protein
MACTAEVTSTTAAQNTTFRFVEAGKIWKDFERHADDLWFFRFMFQYSAKHLSPIANITMKSVLRV